MSSRRRLAFSGFLILVFVARASLANGQTPERPPQVVTPAVEEEIEPRIIGRPGTTMIGISGFADRAFSTEALMPLNYTVEAGGLRFITNHIAVDAAVAGSGSFGGDDSVSVPTGTGVASLRLMAGGLYFLRPKSMISLYGGADYATQLTRRSGSERGVIVGKVGIQAAMSARAALFVEGGYGFAVTKGSAGERVNRIQGLVGLRIRVR